MNRCLSKVYGRKPMSRLVGQGIRLAVLRWNVLSVGDSEIEHEALKGLLASKWRSSLCKTLKFDSRPSLLQPLAKQSKTSSRRGSRISFEASGLTWRHLGEGRERLSSAGDDGTEEVL